MQRSLDYFDLYVLIFLQIPKQNSRCKANGRQTILGRSDALASCSVGFAFGISTGSWEVLEILKRHSKFEAPALNLEDIHTPEEELISLVFRLQSVSIPNCLGRMLYLFVDIRFIRPGQ